MLMRRTLSLYMLPRLGHAASSFQTFITKLITCFKTGAKKSDSHEKRSKIMVIIAQKPRYDKWKSCFSARQITPDKAFFLRHIFVCLPSSGRTFGCGFFLFWSAERQRPFMQ